MPMQIKIAPTGAVQFIWSDALKPIFDEGVGQIRRASHVEPTPEGKWTADLAPVAGPFLGPFDTRAEALGAEVTWLQENVICQ
jgi:hypothetical protein